MRTHNKATYTPCITSSVSLETQCGWGEKVGQTETKSVEELDGNVIFGEESLKTGGKGGGKVFHGGTPFVRNSGAAFMETTLYYYKVGKIARGWLWTMLKKLTKGGLEKLFISCSQFVY